METGGIQTTAPFHAWILEHPAFVAGQTADRPRGPRLGAGTPSSGGRPARHRGGRAGRRVRRAGVRGRLRGLGPPGTSRRPGDGPRPLRSSLERHLGRHRPPGSDGALAVTDMRLRLVALGVDHDVVVDLVPGDLAAVAEGPMPITRRFPSTVGRSGRRTRPVRGVGRWLGHRGHRGTGRARRPPRACHAPVCRSGALWPADAQGPHPRSGRPGVGDGRGGGPGG